MFSASLLFLASAMAMDVSLTLTNGAVVSGELVALSEGDYELRLADGRTVTFKASEIQTATTTGTTLPPATSGTPPVRTELNGAPRFVKQGTWSYKIDEQRASWKEVKDELRTVPAAAEKLQGEQTLRLLGAGLAGAGAGFLVSGIMMPYCPSWAYDDNFNCTYPNTGKKVALYAAAVAFDIPAVVLGQLAASKRRQSIMLHNAGLSVTDGAPTVYLAASW